MHKSINKIKLAVKSEPTLSLQFGRICSKGVIILMKQPVGKMCRGIHKLKDKCVKELLTTEKRERKMFVMGTDSSVHGLLEDIRGMLSR